MRDGDMVRWYDIDGREITLVQAEALLRDSGARRIAFDEIGEHEVSTVHLVLDHSLFGGVPLIFETMVFPECDICVRTPTKHAALAMHDQVCAELREELAQTGTTKGRDR